MSDEQADEADFDDPAHAPIRDLLSSARVDTPIPADVAARLDATLAELTGRASEPAGKDAGAVVVPLRRRVAPRLLAAAVVVAVAGVGAVGLNQVLQDQADSPTSVTAGAAADSGTGRAPERAAPSTRTKADLLGRGGSTAFSGAGRVAALTAADFATQVRRLDLTASARQLDARGTPLSSSPESAPPANPAPTNLNNQYLYRDTGGVDSVTGTSAAKARACPGPGIDGTSSYAILLDRQPAVLVVHPTKNGAMLVEAWSCDGSQVLAFTTVTS